MTQDDFTFAKFANNSFYRVQNARLVEMADIGSDQRIVDLACGNGGVTRLIVDRLRGARNSVVIGIDHSSEMLRQAMEELNDVRSNAVQFVQSKVEHLSDSVKESVDTVIFCNAIHYVSDKQEGAGRDLQDSEAWRQARLQHVVLRRRPSSGDKPVRPQVDAEGLQDPAPRVRAEPLQV